MATSTLFPAEIEAWRSQIDNALEKYTQFDDDCPSHLAEAIRYCLLAPGKRFSPAVAFNGNRNVWRLAGTCDACGLCG